MSGGGRTRIGHGRNSGQTVGRRFRCQPARVFLPRNLSSSKGRFPDGAETDHYLRSAQRESHFTNDGTRDCRLDLSTRATASSHMTSGKPQGPGFISRNSKHHPELPVFTPALAKAEHALPKYRIARWLFRAYDITLKCGRMSRASGACKMKIAMWCAELLPHMQDER